MLRRLFSLWRIYGYLDLMLMTRDLKTFLSYYISDLIVVAGSASGMWLLAERFGRIGEWSRPQILFLLGYALTVSSLISLFFNYNVAFISRRVGRGQLDHVLIQPQPIWMAILTEGFLPFASTGMMLPGIVLFTVAWPHLPFHATVGWFVLLGLNLLASALIVMAFSFFWGSLAFWEPRAAEEINSATMRLMEQLKPFPLDGVGRNLQSGMLTALPAGFVAWYPSRALLGLDGRSWAVWITPMAALGLSTLAYLAFNRGLHHYFTTGSQRYLSFGHRR